MSTSPHEAEPDSWESPRLRGLGVGRLFALVHDAVVIADGHGRIVAWNGAAERMFGYTPQEAVGRDVAMLVPDALRAQHEAGMRGFRKTGHGNLIDHGTPIELPARHKSGRELVVELTLSAIEHDEHHGRYALAILREVTDRVKLSEALTRERRELEATNRTLVEANEALAAFSYLVSHDLKEPVRAVGAYLTALDDDHAPELSIAGKGLLARARASNGRLERMVRGLLELSRAAQGDARGAIVNPADVLASEACRASFENLLEARKAEMVVAEPMPDVHVAAPLLAQALGNVIANAIRHNTNAQPMVRVSATSQDGGVELFVDDNGPGFPLPVIVRFEEGGGHVYSARTDGGFGLLIARRAIERLGGSMALARSPLGGGRVRLLLPAPP